MEKPSLYDQTTREQAFERINALSAEAKPAWGAMTAAQMMAHVTATFDVINGEKKLEGTPLIARLFKGAIKNAVLNDKPFPKSSRTHPQYIVNDERDFEQEKGRLIGALERFAAIDEKEAAAVEHPILGTLGREERSWSMYKHLDHHLQQFGV